MGYNKQTAPIVANGKHRMQTLLKPNPHLDTLEAEHRIWLGNTKRLKAWENVLAGNYEAAMAEAAVRRLLQQHQVVVVPNEEMNGSGRQADFLCYSGDSKFFVEVACISIQKAEEATGIPYALPRSSGGYGILNDAVWSATKDKADQCAGLLHSSLVAVGTFHTLAAMLSFSRPKIDMLLTSETMLSHHLNMRDSSEMHPAEVTTDLRRSSVFLRPDQSDSVGFRRSSLSGLLLCNLGAEPPRAIGILHPNPVRPFVPRLLPGVNFVEVEIDQSKGQLITRWAPTTPELTIVDRGRGPQLSTSRVTVQDLVPYLMQGCSHEEIRQAIPTLSEAEIRVVEGYYREHQAELLEEDRLIRAMTAQLTNPSWVEDVARNARAERLTITENLRRQKLNGETK